MSDSYILFSFGGLDITVYGAFIALGALLWLISAAVIRAFAGRRKVPAQAIFSAAIRMTLLGAVFSRLAYCAVNIERYMYEPATILRLTEGGACMGGALAGAALGLIISARLDRVKAASLADCFAPGFGLLVICVSLAQLSIGEGWGRITETELLPLITVSDRYGDTRFAVYRMEIFTGAMLALAAVMLLPENMRRGSLTNIIIGLYCMTRVVTVSMREGEVLSIQYFRVDQLCAMAAMIAMFIRAAVKCPKKRIPRIACFIIGAGIATLMEFRVDSGGSMLLKYALMLAASCLCLVSALAGTMRKSRKGGRKG